MIRGQPFLKDSCVTMNVQFKLRETITTILTLQKTLVLGHVTTLELGGEVMMCLQMKLLVI